MKIGKYSEQLALSEEERKQTVILSPDHQGATPLVV